MNIILKQIFKKIIDEFKEEQNKIHFNEEVIQPILKKFTDKIYPYMIILFIMYAFNLILIISILIIILLTRNVK